MAQDSLKKVVAGQQAKITELENKLNALAAKLEENTFGGQNYFFESNQFKTIANVPDAPGAFLVDVVIRHFNGNWAGRDAYARLVVNYSKRNNQVWAREVYGVVKYEFKIEGNRIIGKFADGNNSPRGGFYRVRKLF